MVGIFYHPWDWQARGEFCWLYVCNGKKKTTYREEDPGINLKSWIVCCRHD